MTDPIRIELVSVDAATPAAAQTLPADVVSAISDTGGVVAYEAVSPEGRRVWLRDRLSSTSRPVAETVSAAPGLSGDGCVVAYSVPRADETVLTVVDRCRTAAPAALPLGSVVDVVDGARSSAPALSFDGSTIVWSTGTEIRRYVRPAADITHERTDVFAPAPDTTPGAPGVVTGADVDVSADGTTVVFVAGPGATPYAPAPANVYLWSSAAPVPELLSTTPSGEPGAPDSTSPTISADGTFVVFASTSLDLAVAQGTAAVGPFVVGVDRTAGEMQILVDDATRPTVSADGNHVVYARGDAVRVVSSSATATVDEPIDELAAAAPVGRLAISQHGRWLVLATAAEPVDGSFEAAPVAGGAPSVWAVDRRSSAAEVVDTTSTTSTTTTVPTAPTVPVVTAAPSTSVATTTPPSTTGSTTPHDRAGVHVGAVGRHPPLPEHRHHVPPGRGPVDVGAVEHHVSTVRARRRLRTGSAFASPVDFGPTVVDAGRRTAPVTLTNSTSSTLRVGSVTVQVAGVFSLVADACSGVAIAPAASCSVEVQFSPITVGPAVGSATFQSTDGTVVTADLLGEGVAAPTLDLLPAVAGAGQTVTVFGVGFPAGSTVELAQPGVAFPQSVIVDADGTFAHVVVVLPHTPTGPVLLTVNGQLDVFDDVSAELLVSTRGSASSDAALRRGPVGAIGR